MDNTSPHDRSRNAIILAGSTGTLGRRIAWHLVQRGAEVRALVRPGNGSIARTFLNATGATVQVDFNDAAALHSACTGGSCVVSALSGLREVIIDAQANLLTAAVAAGVPCFIPSDFCIDYTRLTPGRNRNLDLRRSFSLQLDRSPIKATSILNGMFTDLLTGAAPLVLFKQKRILYWGNKSQPLDFTTMEDTAAFTAAAALDSSTPRWLRIAGDVVDVQGLQRAAAAATGTPFGTFRAGGLGLLSAMTTITKTLAPKKGEVFPPWQGMQYLHDMFTGLVKLHPLDNSRYPELEWTTVEEVLARKQQSPS